MAGVLRYRCELFNGNLFTLMNVDSFGGLRRSCTHQGVIKNHVFMIFV